MRFVLPRNDEKEAAEHTVYRRSDNFTAISIRRSLILAAQRLGVERISDTKMSCILHSMWHVAGEYNNFCVWGVSDSRGYQRSRLEDSKAGGEVWQRGWRYGRWGGCRCSRDGKCVHLFPDSQRVSSNDLISTFSFALFAVELAYDWFVFMIREKHSDLVSVCWKPYKLVSLLRNGTQCRSWSEYFCY